MTDKPGVATSFSDHSFDNDGNLTATGSANTYVVKTGRRIRGYFKGLRLCVRIPVTNTSASTLTVDDAGSIDLRKSGNAALAAGDLVAGVYYDFIFDDANDVLQVVDAGGATLTAGEGIIISGGSIMTTIKRRNVADISGGETVIASDNAKEIIVFGGTGTLAFTAAATLGDGFWFIVRNAGTGDITLNPDSSEQIDDLTSWVLYPGGSALITCNATNFRSILLSPMEKTFNSGGTFTTPGVGSLIEGEIWGAGGSGGRGTTNLAGGGGGGGACVPFRFARTAFGATEAITIGAGGAARTTNVAGADGGNSTVGSLITGYGGGAGQVIAGGAGGGGGGALSAAVGSNRGEPFGDGGGNTDSGFANGFGGARGEQDSVVAGAAGRSNGYGGASGGNGDAATGGLGGSALFGGAGGGGGGDTTAGGAGGTSIFGGAGGAGSTAAANASNGTQPGGGGGGSETGNSGAGGNGRVTIRVS